MLEWHAPFDPSSWGLKFSKQYPHLRITSRSAAAASSRAGRNAPSILPAAGKPTAPGPGRFPTYHFDEISSPFLTWDQIAAEYVAAGDDPTKLKAFWNLKLGLPYDVTGDAPDDELLMQRREDYDAERIPPGALLVTASADVQMRGIYVEVVAWGRINRAGRSIADYLDGATTDADGGAFAELTKVYQRRMA